MDGDALRHHYTIDGSSGISSEAGSLDMALNLEKFRITTWKSWMLYSFIRGFPRTVLAGVGLRAYCVLFVKVLG